MWGLGCEVRNPKPKALSKSPFICESTVHHKPLTGLFGASGLRPCDLRISYYAEIFANQQLAVQNRNPTETLPKYCRRDLA